jgi:hypothetical protein
MTHQQRTAEDVRKGGAYVSLYQYHEKGRGYHCGFQIHYQAAKFAMGPTDYSSKAATVDAMVCATRLGIPLIGLNDEVLYSPPDYRELAEGLATKLDSLLNCTAGACDCCGNRDTDHCARDTAKATLARHRAAQQGEVDSQPKEQGGAGD